MKTRILESVKSTLLLYMLRKRNGFNTNNLLIKLKCRTITLAM